MERLDPGKDAAGEACDDVDLRTLRQLLGKVGAAETDTVDDLTPPTQRELRMTSVRGTDPVHGEARDADEWRSVCGAFQWRQLAQEYVIRGIRALDEVDPQGGPLIYRGVRPDVGQQAIPSSSTRAAST